MLRDFFFLNFMDVKCREEGKGRSLSTFDADVKLFGIVTPTFCQHCWNNLYIYCDAGDVIL